MNTLLDTLDYFGFIFLELVVLFLSISTAISLILQYISGRNSAGISPGAPDISWPHCSEASPPSAPARPFR